MPEFRVAVVIPVGPNRQINLERVLDALIYQTHKIDRVVLVYDGVEPTPLGKLGIPHHYPLEHVVIAKHEPGAEQPRNVGVRTLIDYPPSCDWVWFLDTDVVPSPNCLSEFAKAAALHEERCILIGPYEWNPPNRIGMAPDLHNDPRWPGPGFDAHGPEDVLHADLGTALCCFSGNIVWPIERFTEVGGFHPELYHGRCEDGELGLRASAHGVGMVYVREARAYHQWHPFNLSVIHTRNARDVPLINTWHPWVQDRGLIVRAEDGARFNFRCGCGAEVNSLLYWSHKAECAT